MGTVKSGHRLAGAAAQGQAVAGLAQAGQIFYRKPEQGGSTPLARPYAFALDTSDGMDDFFFGHQWGRDWGWMARIGEGQYAEAIIEWFDDDEMYIWDTRTNGGMFYALKFGDEIPARQTRVLIERISHVFDQMSQIDAPGWRVCDADWIVEVTR